MSSNAVRMRSWIAKSAVLAALLGSIVGITQPAHAGGMSWQPGPLTGCVGHAITYPDWVLSNDANSGFTVSSGALPRGLSLADSGEITGTPTNAGSDAFTVTTGDASNTFAWTITPSCSVPGAPTGVTVNSVASGRVQIGWTLPADNGGAGIDIQTIQYSSDSGATWTTHNDTAPFSDQFMTVTGLTNGTSYIFRVSAHNFVGSGEFSLPSTAVTPREAPTITSVTNPIGMSTGATGVQKNRHLYGSGFQSGVIVTVGGVAVRVESVMASGLDFYYADHAPGTVDISVTNPDGQSATLAGGFSYVNPTAAIYSANPCCSAPVSTISATQYTGSKGFVVAFTGLNATGFSNNFIYLSSTGVSPNPFGRANSCDTSANLYICDVAPDDTPSPVVGTIYREIFINTGTGPSDQKIAAGTYSMTLRAIDSNQSFTEINFTVNITAGATPPPVAPSPATTISISRDVTTLGTMTVGTPIGEDGIGPGFDINGDGTSPVYTLNATVATTGLFSPTDPLRIDAQTGGALRIGSPSTKGLIAIAPPRTGANGGGGGGGGGGGAPSYMYVLNGTPIRSGVYTFAVTATVAGATPSTYTQFFTGYIRYATASVVTFNGNGSTSGAMSAQSSDIAALLTPRTFLRSGYTFNGWNTAANGGGTSYGENALYEFGASTTLYAQWTLIPVVTPPTPPTPPAPTPVARVHSVTFQGNGATGGVSTIQSASGPSALAKNGFIRDGYTFDEWSTTTDATGTLYDDGDPYSFASDVTLYALWSLPAPVAAPVAVAHTVTFNGNGATSGSTAAQIGLGPTAMVPNGFIRPGYKFEDWASTPDHTGWEVGPGEFYSFETDITLYAEWTLIPPAPVLITETTPLQTSILAASPTSLNIEVLGSDGAHIPVMVEVPTGTLALDGLIRIAMASTPALNSAGQISLNVQMLDSFGAVIPQINKALILHFKNRLGENVVASSTDGFTWREIPLITNGTNTLSPTDLDGYYLDSDGNIVVVTNHLTYFGFKKPQASHVLATVSAKTLAVNSTLKITAEGGVGTAGLGYDTTTPAICSVTQLGVVRGLKPGKCSLIAIRGGDAQYLSLNSPATDITVVSAKISALGSTDLKQITVNLGTAYANRFITIQAASPGVNRYDLIAQLTLNSKGALSTARKVRTGSTLRVIVSGKVVATLKVTGKS
jgi:uncharacterized repeat protein (TIGR02543 family)